MAQLLQPKQQLAGYEIDELVGKGGMGEVYRACQISMDRVVALKILAPRLAKQDPIFAKRFVDEARAAGRLNHPNIIAVHDVGKAPLPGAPEGEPELDYFSMEYVDGESVKDVIDRQGVVPLSLVAQIMLGMAEALVYAEAQGIVHRDIKPDNIMLTNDNVVKLADLGLALQLGGEEIVSEKDDQGRGKVMGTPLYMSPEQARALAVDSHSDQYSLGATLFHMLTGKPPFKGENAKAIMRAHVFDPVPDPKTINHDISEAWRQLSMKLMAKNPQERFANAQAMKTAVVAAISGHHVPGISRRQRIGGSTTSAVNKVNQSPMPPWAKYLVYGFGAAVVLMVIAFSIPWGSKPTPPPEVPKNQLKDDKAEAAKKLVEKAKYNIARLPDKHDKAIKILEDLVNENEFSSGPARDLLEKELSYRKSMLSDQRTRERKEREAALAKQRQAKSIELEQAFANGDLVRVKACIDFLTAEMKHLSPNMQERLGVIKNQFAIKLVDLEKSYTDQLLKATSGEEIEEIKRQVTSSPLSPAAIAQISELAEKQSKQYQTAPKPVVRVDDKAQLQEFYTKLNKLRGGMNYGEISRLADQEADKFVNPDSKELIQEIGSIGRLAAKTEGALRVYVMDSKPEVVIQFNDKPTKVKLVSLDKQVGFILRESGGNAELKQDRQSVPLPLQELAEGALKGISLPDTERVAMVASLLWVWRIPEASALFATIDQRPIAKAIAELDNKTRDIDIQANILKNGSRVMINYNGSNQKNPWYLQDFVGDNLSLSPKGGLLWSTNKTINALSTETAIPTVKWNGELLPPFAISAQVYVQPNTHFLLIGVTSGGHSVRIGFNNTRTDLSCATLVTKADGSGFTIPKNITAKTRFKDGDLLKVIVKVDADYRVTLMYNEEKLTDALQLPKGGSITPIIQAVLPENIDEIAPEANKTTVLVSQLTIMGSVPETDASK